MKLLAVSLGLLVLVSFGCTRSPQGESIDRQTEWAYQLIDQGNYSGAIDLFWYLLQREDSPTLRLGLASAYAGRAGVHVHSYWDLALPSVQAPPPPPPEATQLFRQQWEEKMRLLPPNLQKQWMNRSEEVIAAHAQYESLQWRFGQIPLLVTIEQQKDILMAREVINNLPNPGSRLYRALLSLVLFRFEAQRVSEALKVGIAGSPSPCSNSFRTWLQQIPGTLNLMLEMVADLKMAFPRKAPAMAPFERDLLAYRSSFGSLMGVWESVLCTTQ